MSAYGYPLAMAAIFAIIGGFCWLHARRENGGGALPASAARVISVCAALSAAFSVIAITPWRDALAKVFGNGPGMVALVAILLFSVGCFVIDHYRHHHPVRTTALGIVAAITVVMVWAMAPELGKQGSKLGPKTAAAMGQAMHQIKSGQAAKSVTAGQAALTVILAGLALTLLIAVLRASHRRHPFAVAHGFRQPVAALEAGGQRALPGGQHSGGRLGGEKKPGFIKKLLGRGEPK